MGDSTLTARPGAASRLLPLAALCVAAPLSLAASAPRVVEVRVGAHPAFDRVVLELEAPTRVVQRAGSAPGELLVEIEAAPPRSSPRLTGLRRAARLELVPTTGALELRVRGDGLRFRSFLLRDPFRLVVDVAGPGEPALAVPDGAEPVPPAPSPGPHPDAEPEPRGGPVSEPRGTSPGSEPPREPAVPKGRPEETVPAAAPVLAQPAPRTRGEPAPGEGGPGVGVALAVPFLLAVLVGCAAFLWRRRRPRSRVLPAPEAPGDAGSTDVSELLGEDRIDLLERRIDEEVRSRVEVEARLGELQEDLKVLRDRLNRAARGEPGGR